MSAGVPLDITVRSTNGRSLVGIDLYILEVGDPDRWPDLTGMDQAERDAAVTAFLATETEVQVYEDRELTVEVDQPLLTGIEGRTPYYVGADSVDRYAPQAAVNPIKPQELAPGWMFRGGGVRAGVPPNYDPPHGHDYTLSDRWGVKPGRRSTGPAAPALAARVGGIWTDMRAMRSVVEGMIRIIEASDPAELRFGRTPGQNIYDITGGESIFRKHPVGHTTTVATDAAPGATEVFLTRTKSFPEYYDGSVADVSLMVDGQAVTYESISGVTATLSGDHALFATELKIADNQNSSLLIPSSGRIRLRGLTLAYTGKEQILAAEADGLQKAGATTLLIRNVSAAEWDVIPQTEGALLVQVVGTNQFRRLKYTAASYNAGTEKATFTLDVTTKIARNVFDAAPVTMHKLTGITSDFQGPTLGSREIGDTTLTLNKIHPDSGAEVDSALVDQIPSSGFLRVETEVLQTSGPGKWDYPIARLAYTAFDGDTFTLAEPLPADVPEASWMWIEGCEGLLRERNSGTALTINRLNGVTGLDAGASAGELSEFSPRYRQPGQGTATDGFITGDKWEPGGWSAHKTLIGFGGSQGGIGDIDPGGRVGVTITSPGSGTRLPVMAWLAKGIGILGSGVRGDDNIDHNLHVGDIYCRVQPPNIEIDCDCDPSDEDCECDDEGGPGQIASATVNVNTTVGFPDASRVKITVHNRETGGNEEREFDYTGVSEEDPPSITGFTFDQFSHGPKTALNGAHDLAVVSELTVDATTDFPTPQAQHGAKLRALDTDGETVLATFTYTDRTNFIFTGLVVTSGSGTLPDGTLIEEDYALGDFWLDSGAEISPADNVRHAAFGSATNMLAGTDRPDESQVEIGVIGGEGEPGVAIGDEELLRDEDDDLTWKADKLATQDFAETVADLGKFKAPARAATTANITLANLQTIDGVVLAAGDRVLVKAQTDQTENGIYECKAGTAWTRTDDANAATELEGAALDVQEGAVAANTSWRQTTIPLTLGSSNIVWIERASINDAGTGATRTGNTINVVGGDGIDANADDLAVDSTVARRDAAQTFTKKQIIAPDSDTQALDVRMGTGTTAPLRVRNNADSANLAFFSNVGKLSAAGATFASNRVEAVGDATADGDAVSRGFGDGRYATKLHASTHAAGGSDPLPTTNLSGTHAARPAAGTAGRTYFATDTHVLYHDTGAAWIAVSPGFVRKAADETVNNSATLQNDNELFFPGVAGETWFVEAFLKVQSTAAADFKFGWANVVAAWGAFGSSAVTPGNWNAVDTATTPGGVRNAAETIAVGSLTGNHFVKLAAWFSFSASVNAQLQWAQNTATAVDSIVRADSMLRITRLV